MQSVRWSLISHLMFIAWAVHTRARICSTRWIFLDGIRIIYQDVIFALARARSTVRRDTAHDTPSQKEDPYTEYLMCKTRQFHRINLVNGQIQMTKSVNWIKVTQTKKMLEGKRRGKWRAAAPTCLFEGVFFWSDSVNTLVIGTCCTMTRWIYNEALHLFFLLAIFSRTHHIARINSHWKQPSISHCTL